MQDGRGELSRKDCTSEVVRQSVDPGQTGVPVKIRGDGVGDDMRCNKARTPQSFECDERPKNRYAQVAAIHSIENFCVKPCCFPVKGSRRMRSSTLEGHTMVPANPAF